jgi:hypothetical protein
LLFDGANINHPANNEHVLQRQKKGCFATDPL